MAFGPAVAIVCTFTGGRGTTASRFVSGFPPKRAFCACIAPCEFPGGYGRLHSGETRFPDGDLRRRTGAALRWISMSPPSNLGVPIVCADSPLERGSSSSRAAETPSYQRRASAEMLHRASEASGPEARKVVPRRTPEARQAPPPSRPTRRPKSSIRPWRPKAQRWRLRCGDRRPEKRRSRAVHDAGPGPPPTWSLVWSDEFDKDGAPDPANWGLEGGLRSRNQEPGGMRRAMRPSRVDY